MCNVRSTISDMSVNLSSDCMYPRLQVIMVADIGHRFGDVSTEIETPATVLGVERNSIVPEATCNIIDFNRPPHWCARDTSHTEGTQLVYKDVCRSW